MASLKRFQLCLFVCLSFSLVVSALYVAGFCSYCSAVGSSKTMPDCEYFAIGFSLLAKRVLGVTGPWFAVAQPPGADADSCKSDYVRGGVYVLVGKCGILFFA